MLTENNQVHMIGKIAEEFLFHHKIYGESFYLATLETRRLSGRTDKIPLMVSGCLIDMTQSYIGETVEVNGQFRSHNWHEGDKNHLMLYVFAADLNFASGTKGCTENNQIHLNGYICKPPTYRETPQGREIADLLIAVNRTCGKSDYIPCIVWGRNARYAAGLPVGHEIELRGRIQSREYTKYVNDIQETRTAYEISVHYIA